MKPLKTRTAEEGVTHHKNDPVRVYTDDFFHAPRIKQSVSEVGKALESLGTGPHIILELACGTGDICGQFAADHAVTGIDCNPETVSKARERWPGAVFMEKDVTALNPTFRGFDVGDVLILCETLEHLSDPKPFVEAWLPLFRTSVISHPIDGDLMGDLSGGDHCWSYSLDDFLGWFKLGGHVLQHHTVLAVGGYNIAIGWGKREAQ